MAGSIEQDLLTDASYKVERVITDPAMRAVDRRRMVALVVADATDEILRKPNANPIGLAVTTTPVEQPGNIVGVRVLVTCPRYERVMAGSPVVFA